LSLQIVDALLPNCKASHHVPDIHNHVKYFSSFSCVHMLILHFVCVTDVM